MSATANVHELPVANRETMRDFLANIIAEHIHLVAMKPDDDPYPVGQWFGADADGAATWASAQNANGKNVYWTVNRTREGLNKKPKKSDIVSARFAHVDLDPPKDGSPWDRTGALHGVTELDMPPSFVLDSGGGFGVFWRLEYAAENWPAIELLNQSLEDILGGDHCHNIDRLTLLKRPTEAHWAMIQTGLAGRKMTVGGAIVGQPANDTFGLHQILTNAVNTVPERAAAGEDVDDRRKEPPDQQRQSNASR